MTSASLLNLSRWLALFLCTPIEGKPEVILTLGDTINKAECLVSSWMPHKRRVGHRSRLKFLAVHQMDGKACGGERNLTFLESFKNQFI